MSLSPSFSFSSDIPDAFQLTPYQQDGTYAACILFVQNQFKRHDVEALYQFIREVTAPLPLPELAMLRANATDMKVLFHRLDAGNIHITIHWFEHLSFEWDGCYQPGMVFPLKQQRSPYAIVVQVGDEELPVAYGGDVPILIPSLKAMLFAHILQMCENEQMPHEAFRYYDLFDHELDWLTLPPIYRCKLGQPPEEGKEKQ